MESLYIIATPIGNLEDITLRAIKILKQVDFIICEDSRVSNKLLSHLNITNKKIIIYNDHSNDKTRDKILSLLKSDNQAALISDAGTPLISDPGYKLITLLQENNISYTSLPGPSSIINAIVLSGLATNKFAYLGFLSPKKTECENSLLNVKSFMGSLIILVTPKKLLKTLNHIHNILGDRSIAILREMTKIHEEIIKGKISNIIENFSNITLKGEMVLIVNQSKEQQIAIDDISQEIKELKLKFSSKDLADFLSKKYNLPKKEIYNIAKNIPE